MPVMVASESGLPQQVGARIEAFVSLDDPKAKGIHMSRLYLAVDELAKRRRVERQQRSEAARSLCGNSR